MGTLSPLDAPSARSHDDVPQARRLCLLAAPVAAFRSLLHLAVAVFSQRAATGHRIPIRVVAPRGHNGSFPSGADRPRHQRAARLRAEAYRRRVALSVTQAFACSAWVAAPCLDHQLAWWAGAPIALVVAGAVAMFLPGMVGRRTGDERLLPHRTFPARRPRGWNRPDR